MVWPTIHDRRAANNWTLVTRRTTSQRSRHLQIDNWRIVYLITEDEKAVDIVAVRKRPPYDYGDLAELLSRGT
jgi:mRNA-degrading endonuclease RelE of RelBE toxin-antitoxin system